MRIPLPGRASRRRKFLDAPSRLAAFGVTAEALASVVKHFRPNLAEGAKGILTSTLGRRLQKDHNSNLGQFCREGLGRFSLCIYQPSARSHLHSKDHTERGVVFPCFARVACFNVLRLVTKTIERGGLFHYQRRRCAM